MFYRKPFFQLLALCVVSCAVYFLVFVLPFSIFEWWQQPGLNISRITHNDPVAGAVYVLAVLALFLCYWLAAHLVARFPRRKMWAVVIGGALAFNAVMIWLYPVDAADVFDYIIRGRMQAQYGANPFYDRPFSLPEVKQDPLYKYVGWTDFPTAYGPWWEIVTSVVARLPGDNVIANVLTFKLVSLAAYAGIASLIALTLRRQAPRRTLFGVTLFAWNPLVIYSIAGSSHNDPVMLFFVVLAFFLLARRRYTWAALAMTGGALVKFIPALIFPVIVVGALKQLPSWQSRLRYLTVTGIACAFLVALSVGYYWRAGDMSGGDWRSYLFTTSLPSLVKLNLQERVGDEAAALLVSRAAIGVLGLWIAAQLVLLWRMRDNRPGAVWQASVRAGLYIFLFFLLFSCLWIQPWYSIWLLPLVALLPDGILLRGGVLTTLAFAFKMPIFDFFVSRGGQLVPPYERELQVTLGTLGLPWLYFLYHSLERLVRRVVTWRLPDARMPSQPADRSRQV